jgi:hypothetical protein
MSYGVVLVALDGMRVMNAEKIERATTAQCCQRLKTVPLSTPKTVPVSTAKK